MTITVYHGSTERIEHPMCRFSRLNLDFGQGFYLTERRDRAVLWAQRVGRNLNKPPMLNCYTLDRETIISKCRTLRFDAYDANWLDFIIACRGGFDPSAEYDYIEGGVANDRVVDTVNLYMLGLMDADTALHRLAMHQPNNQICLLDQATTDQYLHFDGIENL